MSHLLGPWVLLTVETAPDFEDVMRYVGSANLSP